MVTDTAQRTVLLAVRFEREIVQKMRYFNERLRLCRPVGVNGNQVPWFGKGSVIWFLEVSQQQEQRGAV